MEFPRTTGAFTRWRPLSATRRCSKKRFDSCAGLPGPAGYLRFQFLDVTGSKHEAETPMVRGLSGRKPTHRARSGSVNYRNNRWSARASVDPLMRSCNLLDSQRAPPDCRFHSVRSIPRTTAHAAAWGRRPHNSQDRTSAGVHHRSNSAATSFTRPKRNWPISSFCFRTCGSFHWRQ